MSRLGEGLNYETYEEAVKNYSPEEKWTVFDGKPEDFNVANECVDRHVDKGIAIKIKFSDGSAESYTFRRLSRSTSQFANMLKGFGVHKGSRVAIMLDPSLEFYVALIGTLKRGAVAVVCSPLFGPEAMEYRLEDSKAQLLVIAKDELKELNTPLVQHITIKEDLLDLIKREKDKYQPKTSADDLAVIQYTSGTTGPPKAIHYRHKSLVTLAPAAKFAYGIREGDTCFCPSSPAWGHGMWAGTFAPLMLGVPMGARSGKFEPDLFLEALEEFRANNVSAVPTVYRRVLATSNIERYDLRIQKLTYTGEYMDIDTFNLIKKLWGVAPHSIYGSTEVGPIIVDYAGFKGWVVKPGSLGKPMLGVEVAILDEQDNPLPPGVGGDIAVKLGGKWTRVGDAGLMDEDGYYWYKGRTDDVIKSSGYRIGPEEVEHAINMHEAVLESAVVGVPNKEKGQVVKAFVKLKSEYEPSEELKRKIQEFTKAQLSRYAYPRVIEFISEIPKTTDGKMKRKKLRSIAQGDPVVTSQFICPFCGRNSQEVKREGDRIVMYECSLCGSLTAAYLKEFHDLLKEFFKRYRLDTFEPKPPTWIKRGELEK